MTFRINDGPFAGLDGAKVQSLGTKSGVIDVVTRGPAQLRPEVYGRMTTEALTASLKPYGISTGHQVWGRLDDGTGANRRGLLRAEVLAAVDRRKIRPIR